MILTLIALIAITGLAIFGTKYKSSYWDMPFFNDIVCPMVAGFGFLGLLTYSILAYGYVAAEYKADIVNAEYGTNYTQAQVFYASSVIDTIRELDRKRIELNGDLVTGE